MFRMTIPLPIIWITSAPSSPSAAMIAMAKNLGKDIVAESVETAEQRDLLLELGRGFAFVGSQVSGANNRILDVAAGHDEILGESFQCVVQLVLHRRGERHHCAPQASAMLDIGHRYANVEC